jgi:hypothetical protein
MQGQRSDQRDWRGLRKPACSTSGMTSAIHWRISSLVIDPGQDDAVEPGLHQRDQLVDDLRACRRGG